MESINTVGKGYYNYYHTKCKRESKEPGKADTPLYDLDLSTKEIQTNTGMNRESPSAAFYRKLADKFYNITEANRNKYKTAEEATNAIWAKYSIMGPYKNYSSEECSTLAMTEINMTLYGISSGANNFILAELMGEDFTKNTPEANEESKRIFNINMLGKQIGNVWQNNGINSMLMGNSRFRFSVNGMTKKIEVTLIEENDNKKADKNLIEAMTKALNTGDNGRKLFYNLLYDASKQGLLPSDQRAKYLLSSEFYNITGLNISDFKQTDKGFVNDKGENAVDIYKEVLNSSTKVSEEFKGVSLGYFKHLVEDAMRYNISEVADLTLSLDYQNGNVEMHDKVKGFDVTA